MKTLEPIFLLITTYGNIDSIFAIWNALNSVSIFVSNLDSMVNRTYCQYGIG